MLHRTPGQLGRCVSLCILALCFLTTLPGLAQAACPALSSSYVESQSINNTCGETIIPKNEICRSCLQFEVPICYCPPGYTCNRGENYPDCEPCPAGYYCPTNGDYSPIVCPEGYFCASTSWFPRPCYATSYCPQGSSRQYFLGGIFSVAAAIVLMFFALALWQRSTKAKLASIPSQLPRSLQSQSKSLESGNMFAMQSMGFSVPSEASFSSDPPFSISPAPGKSANSAVPPFSIQFQDLTLEITLAASLGPFSRQPARKICILSGITGSLPSGKLTALMGPSGAGKTTFLNVLCGKVPRTSGRIFINGVESEMHKYRRQVGFVPQDDIMLRELTVEDILTHSARVRLPRGTSEAAIQARVDKVIQDMLLTDVRYSVVGDELTRGISGGQRKRVNVGMELVANLSACFLDEPTSGLDSSSAEEIVEVLRKVAASGLNVIAVIHQPRGSIFSKFDNLVLLGVGGKPVYIGETSRIVPYFDSLGFKIPQNESPPDFVVDVLSGSIPQLVDNREVPFNLDTLVSAWQRSARLDSQASLLSSTPSSSSADTSSDDSITPVVRVASSTAELGDVRNVQRVLSSNMPSLLTQTLLFSYRAFLQLRQGLRPFAVEMLLFGLCGIFLGLAFQEPKYVLPLPTYIRQFCSFTLQTLQSVKWCISCKLIEATVGFMALYMSLGLGVMSAALGVKTFGNERALYYRDASTGIRPLAYFLGKALVDVFKALAYAWSFLSFFYLLASPFGSIGLYFAAIWVHILCMMALGYITSMIFQKTNAILLSTLLGVVWSLTTGEVFSVEVISVFGYISFPRWFGEAIYSIETADMTTSNGVISSISISSTNNIESSDLDYGAVVASVGKDHYGYGSTTRIPTDIVIMAAIAVAFRVVAFLILKYRKSG